MYEHEDEEMWIPETRLEEFHKKFENFVGWLLVDNIVSVVFLLCIFTIFYLIWEANR